MKKPMNLNKGDKIAIVCKYNTTNLDELAETKKLLSNVQEKISGVVINKIPTSRSGYGYYHGYGYYGKDYTEE